LANRIVGCLISQDELKAQKAQTKALQVHDKAYKKFLKQKEVYDRIESELRSREDQYEATRQHAQAQTEILAQKSAELNDLRAQKAADDVSLRSELAIND
jgi:hypothetical protein